MILDTPATIDPPSDREAGWFRRHPMLTMLVSACALFVAAIILRGNKEKD